MTELSEKILTSFQIRKKKAQKLAFIAMLRAHFPDLQVEEGGLGHNRNLVVGDVSGAKVLLTAHYDTCARLPFPNLVMPRNIPMTILYNLLVCIPFLLVLLGAFYGLNLWLSNRSLSFFLAYFLMMGLMFFVLMGGPANPHTANDNTSGVITLCELLSRLTPEERREIAFVFFDNEENGLLGSSFFAKKHKADKRKDQLVLNFDCVSDGDTLLFVVNKPAGQRFGEALRASFPPEGKKQPEFAPASNTFYPSDQRNFPVNIAVSSMKRGRFGLYMDKIHTPRDTSFDCANIDFLVSGTERFLKSILK